MFRNYLKIAVRNLLKFKAYAVINIVGLAVGIAACLLILLYVQDELSYDKFHQNADRIYRVISEESENGVSAKVATTYAPLTPIMLSTNPEIENVVRLFPHSVMVKYTEDVKFQEDKFFFCDSSFFDVFSFKLLQGDPKTALTVPNGVVVTEETAQRYFGKENPIGKTLRIENQLDVTVTGVLENVPHNSHISFDFLASMNGVNTIIGNWVMIRGWHWPPMYTYAMLPENFDASIIAERLPEMARTKFPESTRDWMTPELQPLTDIHLYSTLQAEVQPTGNITYIYLFAMVAAFILLIACINFMNLATARSANRAKEVGLRKVVGAERAQLIKQFLGESLVYAVVAMILAIAIVEFFLPTFNSLIGKDMDVAYTENIMVWVGLIGTTLIVGLLAGSYPAFFLARFRPIQVLQGKISFGGAARGPKQLRSALVVLQFVISIALIIVTAGIHKQLNFIQNNRLGFEKEYVVVIPIRDDALQNNYVTLKNRVLANAGVISATAISNFPWESGYYGFPIKAEGMAQDDNTNMATLLVDPDFDKTFGIEIVEGRGFSRDRISDAGEAFILNQAAIKKFGWESAINKRFEVDKVASGQARTGRVVGVMQDFHLRSLHHEIEPLVAMVTPVSYFLDNLAVRISGRDVRTEVAALQQTWAELAPHRPFEYFFLDDAFDQLYRKEQKLGGIFNWFAGLTIFVGCLGLFGLASFTAEQRTKEIGIRKTLGATVSGIVLLLSKEFTKLVAVAFILAAPVAYYFVQQWLQDFAYKTSPNFWTFLMSAVIVLGVALLTVSYQSIKAALTNPVKSLQCE